MMRRQALNLYWWEKFGDPVLNDLINEALENNRDLQIAIARVEQYYALVGIARSYQFPQIWGTSTFERVRTSQDIAPLVPDPVQGQYRISIKLI